MQAETRVSNDGELLAEFARTPGRGEAAFEELVRRHGALVFGACRRILNHASDAEDAAQAVFVALAQKASDRGLQRRDSLSGWLYATAWHIGVRARAAGRIRARREQEAAEAATMLEQSEGAAQWRDVAPVLDGELNALPEKYRLAIVLHYLQARSVEQIAAATRSSIDAVKQRLCRGRELLRERLSRRGVHVSGALLPLMLQQGAAPVLPVTFAASAAKTAALVASGQALASGLVAQRVLELARDGAAPWSRGAKLRLAVAALALALLGGGIAAAQVLAQRGDGGVTRVRVTVPANGTRTADEISRDVKLEKAELDRRMAQEAPRPQPAISGLAPVDVIKKPEVADARRPRDQSAAVSGDDSQMSGRGVPDLTKFVAATPEKDQAEQRGQNIFDQDKKDAVRAETPALPQAASARTQAASGPADTDKAQPRKPSDENEPALRR